MIAAEDLIVDNFCGGGGASRGVEEALNRPIDIAINHSAEAIAMHEANHPRTRHLREDVWAVDPVVACEGRPVGLAWFSPTCTDFSRAKGGALKDRKIRGLAWVIVKWARAVRPRIIMMENVIEWLGWGPLCDEGKRIPDRVGEIFRRWRGELESLGYKIEYRTLVAADYGAPTTRQRLFLIARCDGLPIVWPTPTHGRGRIPWVPASAIIDWTIPGASIFGRKKPLAEATLRRIATGIRRYVIDSKPFIVNSSAMSMVQTGYGEREGQAPRALDINKPLGTVVAGGAKHALIAAHITKHYGGPNGHMTVGHEMGRCLGTITAQDHHALTTATLTPGGHSVDVAHLLATYAPSKAREASLFDDERTSDLVRANGEVYAITDVSMRMLTPAELYRAQGFPASYQIAPMFNGKPISKTAQIRLVGNSVAPCMSRALVEANTRTRMEVAA
jgi:DNA (cytosine-5)-methyltransferase 1